jgi:hypothetical protein
MTSSNRHKFAELHFGYIDASEEASEEPQLLIDGYYDFRDAVYGVASGRVWLILGPKGSGKTAVLENIRLTWQDRPQYFFRKWSLAGFPVNDVTQIQMGQAAGGSRSQAAWEFLLLLQIVDSLSGDEGLVTGAGFTKLVKGLRDAGFLSGDWLSQVARWTSTSVKLDAKVIGADFRFDASTITPLEISAYIREQIASVSTQSRHVVAIDGLDSFFFEANDEWTSLAGLMQALHRVNTDLSSSSLSVRVVAAVRSDVLDVLPGPEINKLKAHAVYLDWQSKGIGSANYLWHLLSRKVSATASDVKNVVSQYLNTSISIGPHSDLPEYLLDNTRLLPRDLVALMGYLQKAYKGDKNVTEASAKMAVQNYAEQYFVGEIFDNLAGVLPASRAREVNSFKDALRTAPSRFFTFQYMCEELSGELEPPEVKKLLRQMFETGGIGIKNGRYTDFVFRKVSGAGFSTRYEFMLHDALTRAWNRPW